VRFSEPLQELKFQSLLADKPLERSNPGLILLEQIGGGRIFIKVTGFVLLHPDPDQVAANVVALGEPMQGLPTRNS
jgi:hypothetical protein